MSKIKPKIAQFGLVAAALGMTFGHTASGLIDSVVNDAVMPIFALVLNIDDWENHAVSLGSYVVKWGEITKNMIRLLVVSVIVVYVLRWLKEESEG
jgi:large-conductance mechanosensitive channel